MTVPPKNNEFLTLLTAMEKADELRHQETMLQSHIDAEESATAIKAKLASIYKENGIAVSEAVLDEAVKSSLENRFIHRPVPDKLQRWMARQYIDRIRWGKRLVATFAAVLALTGTVQAGQYLFVTLPAERAHAAAVAAINDRRQAAGNSMDGRRTRIGHIIQRARALTPAPAPISNPVAHLQAQASADLDAAAHAMVQAVALPLPASATIAATAATLRVAQGQLDQYDFALSQIDQSVNTAEMHVQKAEALLRLLTQLRIEWQVLESAKPTPPQRQQGLQWQEQAILALENGNSTQATQFIVRLKQMSSGLVQGRELGLRVEQLMTEAKASGASGTDLAQVEGLAMAALSSIQQMNVEAANTTVAALGAAVSLLGSDITLQIVSESGVQSGVWRFPNDNPSAKNFYLVVDAMDASGNRTEVPVVNEETNAAVHASRFGVRVSEAEFEKVKADKMDNGIIENNIVGKKSRGRLTFNYLIPSSGGVITSW